MGVLSRFTNYIKTVMSSFLDRAEDPGQALDYSYEKQLEQLQNLKKSLATLATSKSRLKLQQAQLQQKVDGYEVGARTALASGDEDLARQTLERKQEYQTQVAQLGQQIDQLQAQQDKMIDMKDRVETRIESFRSQKEMVKSTYDAAQAQVRIHEAASGISEEMTDVNLAVERAQNKVLQMQARANALDELSDSGALPEIGSSGGDSLDRKIAALGKGSQVDTELAAMKAQMQLPAGGPAAQPQIAAPSEAPSGGHGND